MAIAEDSRRIARSEGFAALLGPAARAGRALMDWHVLETVEAKAERDRR